MNNKFYPDNLKDWVSVVASVACIFAIVFWFFFVILLFLVYKKTGSFSI